VEIHGYLVGDRIALAREDESARDFVVLEREVDVHVDLARDELATACRTYAALAREWELDAVAQPRVDDVLPALLQQERALRAVDDDAHFAFGSRGLRQWSRHV